MFKGIKNLFVDPELFDKKIYKIWEQYRALESELGNKLEVQIKECTYSNESCDRGMKSIRLSIRSKLAKVLKSLRSDRKLALENFKALESDTRDSREMGLKYFDLTGRLSDQLDKCVKLIKTISTRLQDCIEDVRILKESPEPTFTLPPEFIDGLSIATRKIHELEEVGKAKDKAIIALSKKIDGLKDIVERIKPTDLRGVKSITTRHSKAIKELTEKLDSKQQVTEIVTETRIPSGANQRLKDLEAKIEAMTAPYTGTKRDR